MLLSLCLKAFASTEKFTVVVVLIVIESYFGTIQFDSIYSLIPNACTTIIFKCLQYSYTRVSW
jgi:hypothetical protein